VKIQAKSGGKNLRTGALFGEKVRRENASGGEEAAVTTSAILDPKFLGGRKQEKNEVIA